MNEQPFYLNCELWAKFNPKQAVLLPYLEVADLSFTTTKHGEPNLCKSIGSENFYFHSPEDARKEASEWFKNLSLKDVKLLCVYGVGLGYYYLAALEWLKEDPARQLVFLEDDLAVIHHFFQTDLATEFLNHSQLQLLFFKDLAINDPIIENLYWHAAMTQPTISALQLYQTKKSEEYDQLKHKLSYDFTLKNSLVEEYLKYGVRFFFNFYQNIHQLPNAYLGNKLYGCFKNIPAIICGAGPSLSKHLPLLLNLSDKALIFAGGSAMNALNSAGIHPHFGAGIDPNPTQLDRIKSNTAYEVPYFYRNRIFPQALEAIKGPHLYITGCGGYDVSKWYEENLNIEGEDLDEGHNVINFCLQTAKQLGCNPIIFVGVDLGFTDSKSYAPGIEEIVSFDPNKKREAEDYDTIPILKTDIYGKPFYTLWKWVAESEWIGEFAKENQELILINSTEGGLGFPDVTNKSLEEVSHEYLQRQYPILECLHGTIQNSQLTRVTHKKVFSLTEQLKQSLIKCLEYLTVLLDEIRSTADKLNNKKDSSGTYQIAQSGYAALCEIELSEEPGYKYVLEMFNAVKSKLLEYELFQGKLLSEYDSSRIRCEVNIKRLTFLKEVATANIALIDLAIAQAKPKKRIKSKTTQIVNTPPKIPSIPCFNLINLPKNKSEGELLPSGHVVRIFKEYGQKTPIECRLEKEGILDGECLQYYRNGKVKMQMFYSQGLLHGPVKYFSPRGLLQSESSFIKGKREGTTALYYNSGSSYALLNFINGRQDGVQNYFIKKNCNLKTSLRYSKGKLVACEFSS